MVLITIDNQHPRHNPSANDRTNEGRVHRAVPHGNGLAQAAKDADDQQRARVLLPLPDLARTQVYPLG